ncbi:MAG: TrbI/VirB10 family protein [Bacteriovoracaceae bacterium]|nr:TrbI/VirB10 family protein [Bacteriovoracaceae bacterium]
MEDDSNLGRSYHSLFDGGTSVTNTNSSEQKSSDTVKVPDGENNSNEKKRKQKKSGSYQKSFQILYSAKQVIERGAESDVTSNVIPSGTNFIGKLLDGIDSRNPSSFARVTLPYGIQHSKGGSIPKNSSLLGQVSAGGDSEKIFIKFFKVIFPNGEEYKIDAQALSSNDYSPGIVGVTHSNADTRLAATVALTMVSAAADVLTQRTIIGAGMPMGIGVSQPEATTKNAVLQGVSQLSKEEAQRKAQGAQNAESYITANSDTDLIVSLLSPFNLERGN